MSKERYVIAPIHLSEGYAVSLSLVKIVAIAVIALLTWTNGRGLAYGRVIHNLFTTTKAGAPAALILAGLLFEWNSEAVQVNFGDLWSPRHAATLAPGLTAASAFGLFVAICLAQTGSLFSADTWNNITFTAGEVKDPRWNIPLSLVLGTGSSSHSMCWPTWRISRRSRSR